MNVFIILLILAGEPLSTEEAHTYLRRLVPQDDDTTSYSGSRDERDLKTELNFDFLPPVQKRLNQNSIKS